MDSHAPPPAASAPRLRRGLFVEAALVGLLALTLNLAGNGRVSLWDRDEPRYAACTREMRQSGDWVHPTFNAEPRYHKPVLIYWLMLAGTALGGENPFGERLVSGLAGAGTVLLVWFWGQRMLGQRAGRLAALVLATAPIMVAESKLATTDATLTFLVVGCQFAVWELAQRPSRRAAACFWLFLGLAVLTKSPAGPVLIVASAIASWWWGGPTACWRRLHWRWGPLLALAVVLPWNVAIMMHSHGAYYDVAVGYHIIRRATNGIEEHGGFPGYYVVLGMLTFYPWSALLPAAIAAAWARRRVTPLAGYLLGWVIGPLILLECVRTKLIHYYLPAIPAAAMLVAWLVVRLAESGTAAPLRRWPLGRLAYALFAAIGSAATTGLVVRAVMVPSALRAPLLVLATLIGVAAAFAIRELAAGRSERAARGLIVLMALTVFTAGEWLLPAAEPYRISALVGRRLAALETQERAKPVLSSFQLPGVVFALGHPAPVVRSRAGLVEAAAREGKIVSALLPIELAKLRAGPGVAVEVRETVVGFNIDKGRSETLHLTVIQPQAPLVGRRSPLTRGR